MKCNFIFPLALSTPIDVGEEMVNLYNITLLCP